MNAFSSVRTCLEFRKRFNYLLLADCWLVFRCILQENSYFINEREKILFIAISEWIESSNFWARANRATRTSYTFSTCGKRLKYSEIKLCLSIAVNWPILLFYISQPHFSNDRAAVVFLLCVFFVFSSVESFNRSIASVIGLLVVPKVPTLLVKHTQNTHTQSMKMRRANNVLGHSMQRSELEYRKKGYTKQKYEREEKQ